MRVAVRLVGSTAKNKLTHVADGVTQQHSPE
jgi:hypothetical protein